MAEFVMKELLRRAGRNDVEVESAALHTDEIGSDIHRGTRAKLQEKGIPFSPRAAWLLTAEKAHGYDLLVGMDDLNLADLRRLVRPEDLPKVRSLLSFAGPDGAISWWRAQPSTPMKSETTSIMARAPNCANRAFRLHRVPPGG